MSVPERPPPAYESVVMGDSVSGLETCMLERGGGNCSH